MTLEVDLLYGKSIVGNTYSGVSFKNHHNKFSTFMTTKVKQKYFDIEGTSEIIEGFDDILSAGFSRENLEKVFTSNKEVTDWKVGESFAECYLEENPDIRIHYDFSRDLKNPNSSPVSGSI